MDTHCHATGYRPGSLAGSHTEIGRLLAHLEQRLGDLDRLHREIAQDAQALAHAAAVPPRLGARRVGTRGSRGVRSCNEDSSGTDIG